MANEFAVFLEGIEDLDFLNTVGKDLDKIASQAINKTLKKARTKAAKKIRQEINLPARYVSPSGKGLYVSQIARPHALEGRLTASGRPTSLARYVHGSPRVGKAGVVVEVQPGKAKFMKRVFPLKLPQGNTLTDTVYNLALAIRLRPGERLRNKVSARRVSKGLYILYGPSVDQVFRAHSGSGVANDLVPEIQRDLTDEFLRLLEL